MRASAGPRAARSRPDLPRTVHAVLEGGELIDPDRTARVEAPRGDADLGAEAELAPVGELGRGIVQHDRGIDLREKRFRSRLIGGDDRIGMVRAVTFDVRNGGIDAVHHLGGDDGVEILRRPVILAGCLHARIDSAHGLVAAHLTARVEQHRDQRREKRRCGCTIDQQGLGGAAHSGTSHLGIEHDALGHRRIRGLVDIDVADAFEMREYGHTRLGLDARHQALAAARYDHVDVAVEPREHHADRGAVARRHQRDRALGQPCLAQPFA